MSRIKNVVGIAFVKEGKLLISMSLRSSRVNQYTLVGGGIEEGETVLQAAVRECNEEIGNNFVITENDYETIFDFITPATSDPNMMIHMNVLLSKKEVDVPLLPNEEILEYRWFSLGEDDSVLSESVRKFIVWAKEKGIMC